MSYFSEIYGDLELSARAKLVLVYLHDRANKDGESWYAIGTMAKDLRLSRSTIKRALTELVRQGRVEKSKRGFGKMVGAHLTFMYFRSIVSNICDHYLH